MKKAKLILDFKWNVISLINLFYDNYYYEKWEPRYDDERHMLWYFDYWVWLIHIWDDFWQFDDIFTALDNNMDKKIVHWWHSMDLDHHMDNKKGSPTNIYKYNLIHKGDANNRDKK